MKTFIVLAISLGLMYWIFSESSNEEPKQPPFPMMGHETAAEKHWIANQRQHYKKLYKNFDESNLANAVSVVREAEMSCRAVFIESRGGSDYQNKVVKHRYEKKFNQRNERCRIFNLAAHRISQAIDEMQSEGKAEMAGEDLYYFSWLKGVVGYFDVERLQSGIDIGPFLTKAGCEELAQTAAKSGFHVSYCHPYHEVDRGIMFALIGENKE